MRSVSEAPAALVGRHTIFAWSGRCFSWAKMVLFRRTGLAGRWPGTLGQGRSHPLQARQIFQDMFYLMRLLHSETSRPMVIGAVCDGGTLIQHATLHKIR